MKDLVVVIASNARVRKLAAACCRQRGLEPLIIQRRRVIPEQQLVITDGSVRFGGVELLQRARGAVVLDSGYMWPQPIPSSGADRRRALRDGLDASFRDARESASFWYSFLEILNDCLPLCVNPQGAFAAEAFKPWALDLLRAQGVAVAPFIAGNDVQRIHDFARAHPGPILALPVAAQGPPRWDPALPKDGETDPVFLQALSSREEVKIIAVNGRPVHVQPAAAAWEEAAGHLPRIQTALRMPLAELSFRRADRLVLSDFRAAPDLAALAPGARRRVLAAVCELVAGAGP